MNFNECIVLLALTVRSQGSKLSWNPSGPEDNEIELNIKRDLPIEV